MSTTSLNWFTTGASSPVCSVRSLPAGVESTKNASSPLESESSRWMKPVYWIPSVMPSPVSRVAESVPLLAAVSPRSYAFRLFVPAPPSSVRYALLMSSSTLCVSGLPGTGSSATPVSLPTRTRSSPPRVSTNVGPEIDSTLM